ncbi:putative ABC transporter [Ixodes scapularis]
MGIFRQVMLALWHQLYLRPLVRRRLESLVESLMPPLFCLALVLAGPPFCDTRAELPFSRGIAVHWPCELAEAQVVFKRVAYAPHSAYTERLVYTAFDGYSPVHGVLGFSDAGDAETYARSVATGDNDAFDLIILFGNIREKDTQPPEVLNYTLRYNTSRLHLLAESDDRQGYYPLRRDYVLPPVCRLGDSHLRLVAASLGRPAPNHVWKTRSFRHLPAEKRAVVRRDYAALAFELGLVLLFVNFANDVVADKKSGQREYRKLMGQSPVAYWIGVMLRPLGPLLAASFATAYVLTSVADRYDQSYLHYTNPTLLLMVLYVYTLHMTSFMMLLTSFFSSETYVGAATCIWLVVSLMPHIFLLKMTYALRLLFCLLPNTALQVAMDVLLTFERDAMGLDWSLGNTQLTSDIPSFAAIICIMLMATSLNVLLTLFFDDVLPLSTNVRWGCLFTQFSCKTSPTPWTTKEREHDLFERNKSDKTPHVHIHDVTKIYGTHAVLSNVSLRVAPGEAVAIMGPNGSGKSTLLRIAAGMDRASSGDVYLMGHSVYYAPYASRMNLGYVPEECLLFDYMTVNENIFYYSRSLPYLLECAKTRGDAYVIEMWQYICPELLSAIDGEPEKEVLSDHMSSFAQCVTVLNSKCLSEEQLNSLITVLDKFLKEHFERAEERQLKRKDEDYDELVEEELLEEDDDDVFLLSKVADILRSLFTCYKEALFPYFDRLLPHFARLLGADRPWPDHQWGLCVFDDIIEYGGPACERYQGYFLPRLLQLLESHSAEVRQAASYGIGVLAQFGGENFSKVCASAVPTLVAMIEAPDSRGPERVFATENAISAVSKVLLWRCRDVSVDELVPRWFSWLPVWEDDEENPHVYGLLCSLLEVNHVALLGADNANLPRVVMVMAEAFLKEAIDPTSEVGTRMVTLLNTLKSNGEVFAACVSQLNAAQQEALHKVLGGTTQ